MLSLIILILIVQEARVVDYFCQLVKAYGRHQAS